MKNRKPIQCRSQVYYWKKLVNCDVSIQHCACVLNNFKCTAFSIWSILLFRTSRAFLISQQEQSLLAHQFIAPPIDGQLRRIPVNDLIRGFWETYMNLVLSWAFILKDAAKNQSSTSFREKNCLWRKCVVITSNIK